MIAGFLEKVFEFAHLGSYLFQSALERVAKGNVYFIDLLGELFDLLFIGNTEATAYLGDIEQFLLGGAGIEIVELVPQLAYLLGGKSRGFLYARHQVGYFEEFVSRRLEFAKQPFKKRGGYIGFEDAAKNRA